jgi:hypothetical protein
MTRIPKHRLQIVLATAMGFCLLTVCLFKAWAADGGGLEQRVKVAYLYNFTKFIEWPEKAPAGTDTPFILAVIGTDRFDNALKTLEKKRVKGRSLRIVNLDRHPSPTPRIDMLFVGLKASDEIRRALSSVEDQKTLTVGDAPTFCRNGGLINFYRADKKIRFEINARASRSKGFRLSAQLLKLARIFEEQGP